MPETSCPIISRYCSNKALYSTHISGRNAVQISEVLLITVIHRHASFVPRSNILATRTNSYVRRCMCLQIRWNAMIWSSGSTVLLKFGSQAPLKKLRDLNLSLRRGPWRFWSWLRGLDWLKLLSRCMRTLTGTGIGQQQQQLDEELWDACLIWGDSEGVEEVCVSPDLSAWFLQSSSETRASPPVLLDIGDDDPYDRPTVPEEVPPPHVVVYHLILGGKIFLSTNRCFIGENRWSGTTIPILTLRLWENPSRLTSPLLEPPTT